jgi:hypothetical protein
VYVARLFDTRGPPCPGWVGGRVGEGSNFESAMCSDLTYGSDLYHTIWQNSVKYSEIISTVNYLFSSRHIGDYIRMSSFGDVWCGLY